jgi:hypothetical protein
MRNAERVVLISLLALVGCAKAKTEEPAHEHPTPPEGDDLQRANCEYLERCHPDSLLRYPGGDVDGCLHVPSCFSGLPALNVVAPEECKDVLRIAPCATVEAQLPAPIVSFADLEQAPEQADSPCARPPLPPGVPLAGDTSNKPAVGEPCLASGEVNCQEGSWCRLTVPAVLVGWHPCGTCTPYLQLGEACNDEVRCDSQTTCVDGTCQARLANGEACDVDARCQSYNCDNGVCAAFSSPTLAMPEPARDRLGEECSSNCYPDPKTVCVDRVCVPPRDLGESCGNSDHCKQGLACDNDRCEWIAGCAGIELGGFCDWMPLCVAGAYCGESRHCEAFPIAGDVCDEGALRSLGFSFGASCGDGSYCNPQSDRCEPPLSNGTPCRDDAQCASGWCERDFSSICYVTPTTSSCGAIQRCDDDCGVCAEYPGVAACP